MDCYAGPPNATRVRFNAVFNLVDVEGVNALTQDLRSSVSFVLPKFHELDAAVLIALCWPHWAWFRRLHSAEVSLK